MTTLTTDITLAPPLTTSLGSQDPRDVTLLCAQHGEYTGRAIFLFKSWKNPLCPTCLKIIKQREDEHKQRQLTEQRVDKVKHLLGRSGIPRRFEGRTFENYRAQSDKQQRALTIAQTYAARFEDRLRVGGGLVFCGKPGTGKTHLACAIANHIMNTGRSAIFTSVLRAIRTVKQTYHKESEMTEQQAVDALLVPDLLILDEVGVQFGTDTEKMILFEVLNGRYEAVRPTLVISNLVKEELADYLGARVIDRLQEGSGVVVAFDWETYRGQVHKDDHLPKATVSPVQWEK